MRGNVPGTNIAPIPQCSLITHLMQEGPMPQQRMDDRSEHSVAQSQHYVTRAPRDLTYDEKKAAEAAFRGEPFNPNWSVAAAAVYEGIVSAMSRMQVAALTELEAAPVAEECLTR